MNWSDIISDLLSAGFTQAEVAAFCGRSQPWVNARIHAQGADRRRDVPYVVGVALLRMHRRFCSKPRVAA